MTTTHTPTFIRNAWYVACTSADLTGKPLGRMICNEAMVFYRGEANVPYALEDFCPHRGAPLSLGTVCGNQLQCGYHGLEMGCDGKVVSMPGQRVRGFPSIKRFAVIEKYGFIWVWAGDADAADPAAMPQFGFFENPAWAYGGGLYHIACDYRLMVDNLMDLTHETYVHAGSIGQREIDETPCVTKIEGEHVTTSRHMTGIQAPPFWAMAMRAQGLDDTALVDRWQICHFTPPSHIMIEVGVALAGKGGYDAAPEHKAYSVVVDFITPETDTSIWYHWGMARQFKPQDAELTANIRQGQGKIFGEDLEMLERQQQNLLRNPERKVLMLNIDAGGVQARKIITRKIAAEVTSQAAKDLATQTGATVNA